MFGSKDKKNNSELDNIKKEETSIFEKNKKNIKSLIAPGGIDASYTNHIEISSSRTRYARSMVVANLPRMCTFPELFRDMYMFGDINTSIYIYNIRY